MTEITLGKTETKLLLAAAKGGGSLVFPDSAKPSTRERVLGRFLRDGLLMTGEAGHLLTPAGYRAVGLRPPRAKRDAAGAGTKEGVEPRVTKGMLVLDLLGREDGASLAELIEATGWLPHTTRAALSRLRSAGKPLAKSTREDGTTSYRLQAEEPARRTRGSRPEAQAEAAA